MGEQSEEWRVVDGWAWVLLRSAQAYHPIHHQMNMALKNKSLV